jgi:hypothetical protein
MRTHLSFLALLMFLAPQSVFPQAATEAALANAHAAATTSKLSTMLTNTQNKTNGRIAQSVKTGAPSQKASHAKPPRVPVASGASASKASAATGTGKKTQVTASRAKASTPASTVATGQGPRIISILGGEQQ